MRAATLAAATGAMVAGVAQLGAGTAAADTPAPHALPVDIASVIPPETVPQGLVPAGFQIPDLGPQYAEIGNQIQQWVDSVNPISPRAVQPVSGTLTSDFGPRWGAHHGGIDIAAPVGTPVLAAEDGVVLDAGPAQGYGQWVRLQHSDGSVTVYGHVEDYYVTPGEHVSGGQQIATVGNRGFSTGPHLHFEAHDASGAKSDPTAWLQSRGVVADWNSNASRA